MWSPVSISGSSVICPEDGYWYALYYPSRTLIRSVAYPLESRVVHSAYVTCEIPPELIAEPGLYALAFENVGCCQFEIK